MQLHHHIEENKFVLPTNGREAFVTYVVRDGIMYLGHAEVPYQLRGQGIGKILVEEVFKYLEKNQIKAVAICSYIRKVRDESEHWSEIIG